MEITMYEDGSFTNLGRERESLAQMKRKFTLDLNGRSSKKIRAIAQSNFNPLLTSPDLNMLKLGSPELDKLVLQNGALLATGFAFPAKAPTPTTVSREEFVKGFEDTLDQMHLKGDPALAPAPQYTQLEAPLVPAATGDASVCVKEEPQTVPSVCGTPPLSPINMEDQEKIKLERKRMRNRIAASKCRRRKLERISKLELKVNSLKDENSDLQALVNNLREQVCSLKQEVMQHYSSGCQIPFVSQQ